MNTIKRGFLPNFWPMSKFYLLSRNVRFPLFVAFLAAFLITFAPNRIFAQGCACSNCPQFMPDNFVGDFNISVQGATNPTLGSNGQGICGVNIHFDHEYLGDLSITLTSPSGQSVQLVGPIGFFGPTDGTTWDVSFLPCGDPSVMPDGAFSSTWQNNQAWGLGNSYTGSYYPANGCLQNFNSGPVNGTWSLTVQDGQAVDVGNFYNYEIIFCDPSGINCFSCAANGGNLSTTSVTACEGSPNLNLNINPTYNPPNSVAPPAADYSYTYVISGSNGVIQGYEPGPDLTAYPAGTYTVCGLSYLNGEEGNFPAPGSITSTQLSTQLGSGQPPFCGDMSTGCKTVTINAGPPDEEVFETICFPDCFSFHGQNYCNPGTYTKNLTQNGCAYTATLNLTVVTVPRTDIYETICEGECSQNFGFESACNTGSYTQTFQSYLGCDSVVNLALTVTQINVDIDPPQELSCTQLSVPLQGSTSASGSLTYNWQASNGGNIVGVSNAANIVVNTPGDYELTVCQNNGGMICCNSASVTVTDRFDPPAAPDVITGPNVVCTGGNLNFSITPVGTGGTYNWTVPPGVTINSGQGTTNVSLTWNSMTGGSVCVTYSNSCGTSDPTCLPITIQQAAVPTQPVGATTACAGATQNYQTTANPNATSYNWTVTAPATIVSGQGSNSITVNWGNSTAGSVCVSEVSSCGTSQPVCLPVQITAPPTMPALTGSATGCDGGVANYSITAIAGATSYAWQVTGGTITSGAGTTAIAVTWNANAATGSVCVTATNSCGTSAPSCLNVLLGAAPAQPLISGNNAICAGTSGIYSVAPVTGATGYTWSVSSGGTIASGQNTTSVNINWLSAPGGNVCVAATGACGTGPQYCLPVVVSTQPVSNAGNGGTVCGNSFNLQATPSVAGSSGLWLLVPGAPGPVVFANPNNAATSVSVTQTGIYRFVWQEQLNTCTSDDSVTVSFRDSPMTGQIARTCDATNQNYTVTFPITNGTPPYTVPGGTVSNGVFTSSPIPSGNTYSFQVTDANGCKSAVLTGSFSCACTTSAGTMSLTALSACQGSTVTATHLGGQVLDANDVTAYVLHTGSGTTLGTVLSQNATGTFGFQNGMAYETTYYISFVAGNSLNGQPNPADPCFSVAQGQPVVWHQNPTANAGTDASTCGLSLTLGGNTSTGTSTWVVASSPTGGTITLNNAQSPTAIATASAFGTYTLQWIINNLGCRDTDVVQLKFNSSPVIGQLTRTCDGANQNYTVSFPITGGTAPYTVAGGTVANGTFTSTPIVSGQSYSFQVTDANGCQSAALTGSFNCSCSTGAGTMSLTALSACQGTSVTATHIGGQTLDANDVSAYALHTSSSTTLGTVLSQNATGTFSFQNTMSYDTTYYISFIVGNNLNGQPDPADPCFSVAQGQPVVWHQNPVANAGADADTCGLALPLTGNTSAGIGTWTVVSSSPGNTLSLGSTQNAATTATASNFGTYSLAWTINNMGCSDADTVQLTFNSSPVAGQTVTTCDANNQNYTVSIPLSGGIPPYLVNGTSVTGPTFTSAPIVSGTAYTFAITESNGCTTTDVTGSISCNCSTQAGTMDTAALATCEGGSITATHVGGENLDGNDVTAYVLHTGNGTTLGTVLAQNATGTFSFQTGMTYGTTYYVSFVVGNSLNGQPDPTDPCFAVAAGQPVVWYQNPVANAGVDADTCGVTLSLQGNAGPGQWTVSSAPTGGTLVFTDDQDPQSQVTASTNGSYSLTWTVTSNGCISTDQVDLQFHSSPSLANLVRTCDVANENFTVTLTLTGGTAPYTVNGTAVADSTFVSAPFPNGQMYTFNISDANGCSAPTVNGAYSCNCSTDAGTMAAATLTACEDESITVTANNDQSLDGNDITAYVLHDGSGPSLGNVLAQNMTGVFSFQSGMTFGQTYHVSLVAGNPLNGQPNPLDPCFSVAIGQPVVWLQNPTPNAGPDTAVCGTTVTLEAASGSFPGVWTQVSGPDSTTVFSGNTLSNSIATVSKSGTYVFRWTEANATCTAFDEVTVNFNALPTVDALDETCDGTNTVFTVTFNVVGGTAPYTVTGLAGTFSGSSFTSANLNSAASYSFHVTDANGCSSVEVSGSKNCNCATDAGSVVPTPATFCADQPAVATWNNDATLDANDLVQFILHSSSGTSLGTIYATGPEPSFLFGNGLQPNVVYYISAIAGNNVNGAVDLTDDCLSVTPGTPVQWKLLPTADLTGDATICTGVSTFLSFSGTGSFPLQLNYVTQNGDSSSITLTSTQAVTLEVMPATTTTYTLTNVVDGTLPACSTALTAEATVQVNNTIDAGTAAATSFFCAGTSQTVALAQQLVGADAGGVWTETSAVHSTGAAFNAAAATFNTTSQAPGTYTFRYLIDAAAPCVDDEATVTVVITPTPVADAGPDKTLDCNISSATLGGVNTTAGTGISYEWTLDTAVVGNNKTLTTSIPGTYTLLVSSAAECTATDRVAVILDGDLPSARLSVKGVRCFGDKNGSIHVDSVFSSHPPVLFSLNGGAFSTNTNFAPLTPGDYTVALQDANGCEWTSNTLTVTEPPQLIVTLGPDLNLALGDSALVELQASDSLLRLDTIIWHPLLDSTAVGQPYQHWLPTASGALSVHVVDSSGCAADDRLLVIVDKRRHIYIPNIIQPSAAGNDLVTVFGGSDVAEIESFQIYDRWGEQLFELLHFQPNNVSDGWAGRYRNKEVTPGVYAYYAVVRFKDGEREVFAGDVTVLR